MTTNTHHRIDFITLGCSKNLVDSEHLMRQLSLNGYDVQHDPAKPRGRIVVINTCGFIGDAQEESINTILHYSELKRQHKIDKIFVMGCLSQRFKEDLQKEIPEVDYYFGKFNFQELLPLLGKTYQSNFSVERTITTPGHYAYVKIAEGCNRTCSYCAIPIITGKHQSRPPQEIIDEIHWLVKQGVREIQLIAQDLTYYGYDTEQKALLPDLVNRIADVPGVEWIRLHYAYPAHFPYELLRVMRERKNVCHYLDIALQHSSNNMLQRMRRNITLEQTEELLSLIRSEIPDIHLRTTLLVGHPGETEEDFQSLKSFVTAQRFERLGAFAYSHETGTYAYDHYTDDVPDAVKQKRLDEIMELQRAISAEQNEAKVGQTFNVIIDREEKEFYVGRTEYDSPEVDPEVFIDKTTFLKIGAFYPIKITNFDDYDLYGTALL
jgi:ribosomal protein S12 methylthiotransferase